MLHELWAFLRKDYRLHVSYRLSFWMQILGIVFSVASYFFLAQFSGRSAEELLAAYRGNFFAFILLGIVLWHLLSTTLYAFAQAIRSEQGQGTFEALLLAPLGMPTLLGGLVAWTFALALAEAAGYLIVGQAIFGLRLQESNAGAALLALLLLLCSSCGAGLWAAAVVVVLKRGDPLAWLYADGSALLAGVFYPPEMLPEWMQRLAALVPLTYALRALREALLGGASWAALAPDLATLALFAVALLPSGLWVCARALALARREGSLGHV